jgi:hypothetical protein
MADDTLGRDETERLLLVPWHDDYADDFARVAQDPGAMRFISGGRPLTLGEITSIMRRSAGRLTETDC